MLHFKEINMNYVIIEQQTTAGTTAVLPPAVFTEYLDAIAEYHRRLAYAVKTTCNLHSVSLMDARGKCLLSEAYNGSSD